MNNFISHDGARIAYYVDDFTPPWTTPETIVLLHAAMGNSVRWYGWVPRLSEHFRVVRMDLRGHGASHLPLPSEDFSLDILVRDVLKLLDVVGCESAHIVGNSAGGYVAQKLAIHYPERVKSLALYAATPGLKNSHARTSWLPKIREVGLRQFLADTIEERFDHTVDPNLVQWFIEQAGSNNQDFILRFVEHMCTHDFMDELVKISAPTLMVAAGAERIGHADAYTEMQKRIKGSKLVYINTPGHNIGDAFPRRCVDELLAFLRPA